MDEHSRECLAMDVARKLSPQDVLERPMQLFITRPEDPRRMTGREGEGNILPRALRRGRAS
jgi:hypothetical protein